MALELALRRNPLSPPVVLLMDSRKRIEDATRKLHRLAREHEQQTSARSMMAVSAIVGPAASGKTTLLDALRGTRVAVEEPGGITQNVRAFTISLGCSPGVTSGATRPDEWRIAPLGPGGGATAQRWIVYNTQVGRRCATST